MTAESLPGFSSARWECLASSVPLAWAWAGPEGCGAETAVGGPQKEVKVNFLMASEYETQMPRLSETLWNRVTVLSISLAIKAKADILNMHRISVAMLNWPNGSARSSHSY